MPNLAYNNSPIASSHKSVDFWAENWRVQIFYFSTGQEYTYFYTQPWVHKSVRP